MIWQNVSDAKSTGTWNMNCWAKIGLIILPIQEDSHITSSKFQKEFSVSYFLTDYNKKIDISTKRPFFGKSHKPSSFLMYDKIKLL